MPIVPRTSLLAALGVALALAAPARARAAEPDPAPQPRAASDPEPQPPGPSSPDPEAPDDRLGEEISVVAPSRLPRRAAPGDTVSIETVDRGELRNAAAPSVQDALQQVPGVHLADEQGNPHQKDLSMRGLVASPVTGLSQGLSVFLDGVRVNEPDAEEVNFDLLPLSDLERIEVIRGPHAIFGRNTLGGAIQLVTLRGGPRPKAEVEAEAGSWEHQAVHGRASGPLGALDGLLSVAEGTERGWRDAEASRTLHALGKLGLARGDTDVALSYQYAADRLEQPGSLPLSMLEQDRAGNYTGGDFFGPRLHLVALNAAQGLAGGLALAANAHLRALDVEQFNAGAAAPNVRTRNRTRTWGGTVQVEHDAHLGRARSRIVAGAEGTHSDVAVRVTEEPNATVTTTDRGLPLPQDVAVLADAQLAVGAFVQAQLVLHEGPLAGLGATAALRWDRIAHDVVDTTSREVAAGNDATGTAAYARWVPAAGVSWSFSPRLSAAASWSQGFRAPSFLELTCASPQDPCVGLQAGVAQDATFTWLRPVTSQSFEAGIAAAPLDGVSVGVSAFRVDLHDDIYGVPGPLPTSVYFENVGDTRRQGVEATLRAAGGPLSVAVGYAFTRATFESDRTLATPRLDGGVEEVRPGDRLPMIPEHQLDAEARLRTWRWLELSAGLHWVGPRRFRGDEANVAPVLPAYGVVRAGAEARWGRWSAALHATNLLDARFETFGTYAANARAGGTIEPFLTPGAPLRVLFTLRWELS